MITAVDPNEIVDYVPKCDRELPEEKQTVFMLSILKASDAARMEDSLTETSLGGKKENKMRIRSGSKVLDALRGGLKGFRNFRGADGNEIAWRENAGTPHKDVIDAIPPKIRRELAEFIIEGSELSEDEEKN